MQRVFFKTFGCRSNLYDTQVMINNLKDYEITQDENEANIIVINSCTVTNKADAEARSYARKHTNNGKRVIFTGCGVKHLGKTLYQNNIIHSLFSHSHKENINRILNNENRIFLARERNKNHVDSSIFPQIIGRIRAFIKIQEGCNFKCSYCIIPSVRGNARSFKEDQIIKQVEILAQNGVKEIILTGTNIGSYGLDTNTHISSLLYKINNINGIKRIRMGSLEPSQIDSKFLDALNLEKIEKHLHIALQHTSPQMLRIMNRKNTFESDLELFSTLYNRGFSLGTDYIVGHYGESEEIFNLAFNNLKKMPLTHIHLFIYSPRSGTISAKNANNLCVVRGDISKYRLKKIESLVREKNKEFRIKNHNKILKVLIDGEKNIESKQYMAGLDQYFNRILIPIQNNQEELKKGEWIKVKNYEINNYNIAKEYEKYEQ